MPRAFAILIVPLLAFPGAALAVSGPEGDGTDHVFTWYASVAGVSCSVWDPILDAVQVPTLTTLTHEAQGDLTSYALHVEPPVGSPCAPFDLAFRSPAAWPDGEGSFSTPCGMTGHQEARHDGSTFFRIVASVPASCDAGVVGDVDFTGYVTPMRSSPYEVCAPYTPLGGFCSGVYDGPNSQYCSDDGQHTSISGFLYAGDPCYAYAGEERVIDIGLVYVWVVLTTTDSTCTVNARGIEHSCPEELRALVHGLPWGEILP